jgi:hypothetical protein
MQATLSSSGSDVVALSWVVKEVEGERRFFIQEASTQLYAALRSAIAGFEGGVHRSA